MHRDRCRPLCRLHRARCRLQPRRGRGAGLARTGGLQAGAGALQGLHDRRSAHAHQHRLQRHAEDAGGAARIPEIRARHHRPAEGAGHGAEPLPAVQPAAHGAGDRAAAPGACAGAGKRAGRAAGAAVAGACRARLHARRAQPDGPGHRLRFRQAGRGRRAPDARQRRPRRRVPADRCAVAWRRQGGGGALRCVARSRAECRFHPGGHDRRAAAHGRAPGRARHAGGRSRPGGCRNRPPGRCHAGRRDTAALQPVPARPRRTRPGAGRIRRPHHGAAAPAAVQGAGG